MSTYVVEIRIRKIVTAQDAGEASTHADAIVDRIKTVSPGLLKNAEIEATSYTFSPKR